MVLSVVIFGFALFMISNHKGGAKMESKQAPVQTVEKSNQAVDNAVEFVAQSPAQQTQDLVWVKESGGTVKEMPITTNKFAPDQKSEAEVRSLIEAAKNKKR